MTAFFGFAIGFVIGSVGGVLGAAFVFAAHSPEDDDPEDYYEDMEV